MKRLCAILALLLIAGLSTAQTPPPLPVTASQVIWPLYSDTPPVNFANTQLVGNPGPQTYYYWFVAHYTLGVTSPSGPFVAANAPNALSSSNYIKIIPTYPVGSADEVFAGVDLLRTTSPFPPTGACNCAVTASPVSSGPINDQSNSLNSYTVAPALIPSNFTSTVALEAVSAGVAHLIYRENGVLICDLAIACGAGSGTIGTINAAAPVLVNGGTTCTGPTCTIALTSFGVAGTYTNPASVTLDNFGMVTAITGGPSGTPLFGSGTSPFLPIWTGTSTLGNSFMSAVTSPALGVNYNLGGGLSWQIDAGHITFNSGISATNGPIVIANTWAAGSSNNAGGIELLGADATGSACAGDAFLHGGQSNGANNGALIDATGGCSNGFGAIGANAVITAGSTANSNPGGSVILTPGTGGFGNGNIKAVGPLEVFGNLTFSSDNTYNIGAVGATRPANLYLGTELFTPNAAVSSLTVGNCVLAGTGGLLTSFSGPCGASVGGAIVISNSTTTQPSNVTVPANTPTSVISHTVTMPSTGCPCQAIVTYQLYVQQGNSGISVAWVNDGTNSFATSEVLQNGSASNYGIGTAAFALGTYANSAAVTFTLNLENSASGGATALAVNNLPGPQNAWMNIAVTAGGTLTVNGGSGILVPNLQNGTAGNAINFIQSGSNIQATIQAASIVAAMLNTSGSAVLGNCLNGDFSWDPCSSFNPSLTSPASTQTLVYNGTNWVNSYGGVSVDPQTGNYTAACPGDRLGEIEFNLSSAATLTLPQAGSTACLQSNPAYVVRNASISTALLTVATTTSTFQPEGVSSINVLPGGGVFIYSDAVSGAGNYHDLPIATGFGGVNTQTTNYTTTQLDKDKIVVMNCTAACVLTLPNPVPSAKWNIKVLSIGSTLATVSLNSLTFNGASTPPTLATGQTISIASNGTNYDGDISSASVSVTSAAMNAATQAIVYVKGNYTGSTNSAGAVDTCNSIFLAANAHLGGHIVADFPQGDYACGSHILPSTQLGDAASFTGKLTFWPGQIYHQYAPDSTFVHPGQVEVEGLGQGTTSPTNTNSAGATVFIACASGDTHSYCNGTGGSPFAGWTASTVTGAITSGAVAGGTATITATGWPFYQSQNITISGASISGCNGTFQLASATTFSVGTSGCTTWTGGTATGPPTQYACLTAASGVNTSGFEAHIGGIEFAGNGVPNIINFANGYCQEDSGVYGRAVELTNFGAGTSSAGAGLGGGMGLSLFNGSGTGSTNSTFSGPMNIGNSISTCVAGAIPVQFLNVAPKVFSNISIVNTGCSTLPNYSIPQSGNGAFVFHLEGAHLESFNTYGWYIGGTGLTTIGVHGNDINACCNGSAANSATVGIASGGLVSAVVLENIKAETPNAPPNTLVDLQNSNTLTRTNNQVVPFYAMDLAAYPLTDANPVDLTNGFDFYNGTFAIYSGGTLKASMNNAGNIVGITETLTGLLTVPVGTTSAPDIQATGSASNTGLFFTTAAAVWDAAGSAVSAMVTGGFEVGDTKAYAWSQSAGSTGAVGALIGVVGTGTTEAVNPSTVLLLPQCKITSAVTLSSGATTNICIWNLPNSAQTWAWQCKGNYTITAGTLPTLILAMNAQQTPTSETGNGMIWSASSVQTFGSATSTASGDVSIMTGVTNTTTAAPWESWGTIQASATAGTFAIKGQLGGTGSPAGTILVGSTCDIY